MTPTDIAERIFAPRPKPKPIALAGPAKRVPGTLHLPALALPR
jgi:hypothetical protein